MKNYIVILIVLFSCTKEPVEQNKPSAERRATGPMVDLGIPRLDSIGMWRGKDSVGLMSEEPILEKIVINSYWSKMFNRPIGDTIWVIKYPCTVANYGYLDLVIDREKLGLYDSENNDWLFDWLLQLTLKKNGKLVEKNLKQAFFFTSNQLMYDHPPIAIWYAWPLMWLAQRSGDLYYNRMPVPDHRGPNGELLPDEGIYELGVTVNFRRTVAESDYRNNTGYLNFIISGTTATRDWVTRKKGNGPN